MKSEKSLETYVQEGVIPSKNELMELLTAYLREVVAMSDGLAMLLAYRAAGESDLEEIIELDRILAAQKLARESREGSAKVGARMLRLAAGLYPSPVLNHFDELVFQGKAHGHHGVVFGVVGQAIGVGERELFLTFAYSTAAAMVGSAVRLIPIGLIESGGDNLAATFSPELADLTIFVIDVSGGDKIPRKGGPGVTRSDLLVINKIDLAPYVRASLEVMRRDSERMRPGKPFILTAL
ncbi:MAG: hypothetical protein M1548_02740 [Actinobacteria bacterium]|nr:hypothetical protein [Actinomycetota bacterium]